MKRVNNFPDPRIGKIAVTLAKKYPFSPLHCGVQIIANIILLCCCKLKGFKTGLAAYRSFYKRLS